ncbi:hypothetical protein AURDEDRAFT_113765 [Auricularia subglabra TFB-10046 SS5]|nr:hypothetical protein AURDEDRAFT_113765 [Auricularia subglabra TFB-10046 SS5]
MPAAEVSESSTPVPEAESIVAVDEPAQRLKQSRKRKRPPGQTPAAAAAAAAAATASKASPGIGETDSPGPDGGAVVQLTSGSSRFDPSKPIPACAQPANLVPVPSLPGFFTTQEMAVNRKYRYTDAVEVAPFVFHSQQSPPADCVRVCWEDRSPHIRVTQDGLGLAGDRGYRSARLNVPVREGKWYLEVLVERGGGADKGELSGHMDGAHVRLGWARREAPLEAPVGCDGYSYGFCDKTGHKTTLSRPKPYGRPFGSDDVIGMYISLPPQRKPKPEDAHDPAHIRRKRQAVLLKNRLYFEQAEYPQSKEMMALMESGAAAATAKRGPQARPHGADDENAPTPQPSPSKRSATVKNLPGSGGGGPRSKKTPAPEPQGRPLPTLGKQARIAFFVNGECQGTAFEDIYDYLQLRLTSAMRKAREKEKKDPLKERENAFDDGSLGYYAMISLFNSGRVNINPGPDFKYAPPPDVDAVLDAMDAGADPASVMQEDVKRKWRPLCERYPEYWEEIKAQDLVDDDPQKAAKTLEEAEEKSKVDEKTRADEEKKALQREKRRIRDAARRRANKEKELAMVHGGSKLATASTPADDKMDTGSDAAPTPTPVPTQQREPANLPQPQPVPAPAPLPLHAVIPPEALRYAPHHRRPSASQSPQAIKREFPPPQQQYHPYAAPAPLPLPQHQQFQPFQFAPPYQYPSTSTRPSTSPTMLMQQQRPSTGSVSTLMHAFDSPPRRAAELPPAPPPPQRMGMFDPVRDEYQPRPASGGGNSLQIDTGPSGFHPQWERERERDERPTTSPNLGAPFRYNAGPGMAGGYGPPPPPLMASYQQRHSLSPVQPRSAYGPISPRPALFSYGSGPIGVPTSPVAYVMQAESSLRSGAGAADDDDEEERGGDETRPVSASATQRVWDPYSSGRDRDGDVSMRDSR